MSDATAVAAEALADKLQAMLVGEPSDVAVVALALALVEMHKARARTPLDLLQTVAIAAAEAYEHSYSNESFAAALCFRVARELSFHTVRDLSSKLIAAIAAGKEPS